MDELLKNFSPKTAFFAGMASGIMGLCTIGFVALVVLFVVNGRVLPLAKAIGSARGGATAAAPTPDRGVPPPSPAGPTGQPRSVSAADHLRGDPNAPVKIIEYSDLECPFCKRFHPTMQQVLAQYQGQVAWVYRHFPLDSLHSKARKEAEATECAAELGGNDKFWSYVDRIFDITPSNDGLDLAQLPQIAADLGLDRAKFEECLQSGRHAPRVEADYQDAVNAGGQGTPYSLVIAASGRIFPVSGAQPFDSVRSVIEQALTAR